ncbi:phosphotransferase family protein [Pseudonocardia sp. TRM90224]|uniref:phosphotransferase family protein n=1 Tax=Pseudonocardia sp. TRM90224 TaxID=2812678 RepID=UPI001E338EFB|nr:phosphotransferase [Pseudonocardia sp. TRM90224]
MVIAAGVRISWPELPGNVHRAVEAIVGDRIVEAVSQVGGFSPGTADRVRTAGGLRAFVKAVHPSLNPHTPDMHRREALVMTALPARVPAPDLLGVHDDGEWVALVFEDVDGRQPATPWVRSEVDAVMAALRQMAETLTPAPVLDSRTAAEALADDFAGFDRLAADPHDDLDPWAAAHLDDLRDLARVGVAALAGDTLVHIDVRADNLLVRPDGSVVVVDWPWACTGPAWLDRLMVLVNVNLYGGHDVEHLLRSHLPDVPAEHISGVLAGCAGFFADSARRPAPPGLPTVREFQRAQAEATLRWLRIR